MLRYFLLLILCVPAFAKPTSSDYQDGTLVGFRDVAVGEKCSGSAESERSGRSTTAKGSTECSDNKSRQYTLRVGEHTYIVQESYRFLYRTGPLNGKFPNTQIRVRMDTKGFFVRVGDKEAKYDVVEAQ